MYDAMLSLVHDIASHVAIYNYLLTTKLHVQLNESINLYRIKPNIMKE